MGLSLKQSIEHLARTRGLAAAQAALAQLTDAEVADAEAGAWWWTRRPEQAPPDGLWRWWVALAGRSWGKTRTAAEYVLDVAMSGEVEHIGLAGKTPADVRDVMIGGTSGILACARRRGFKAVYLSSKRSLQFENGAYCTVFSGENPDQSRGYQFGLVWEDEPSAWQYAMEVHENLDLGLRTQWRSGGRARGVITMTPKNNPYTRAMMEASTKPDGSVVITRGSTYDNVDNMDPETVRRFRERYEGTRLGRQELRAEILSDVEGAWWTQAMIDGLRVNAAPDLEEIVVAVDPAATSGPESDETGICVVGKGLDGHAYILADRSCRLPPSQWARRVIEAVADFGATRVVVEDNQGGEMVEETLLSALRPAAAMVGGQAANQLGPVGDLRRFAIHRVTAKQSKRARAEPVHALYEQGYVHHVGYHSELETQMCDFTGLVGKKSPDRLDALVHGVTAVEVTCAPPVVLL